MSNLGLSNVAQARIMFIAGLGVVVATTLEAVIQAYPGILPVWTPIVPAFVLPIIAYVKESLGAPTTMTPIVLQPTPPIIQPAQQQPTSVPVAVPVPLPVAQPVPFSLYPNPVSKAGNS